MARATDSAYTTIRAAIVSGAFSRGERLREERLAALTGVSRTPVREALRRLEAEGLVEFLANRGGRVTAWSFHELDDLYEIRSMLEGFGARLAAKRIDEGELEQLADLAVRMEQITTRTPLDVETLTTLNSDFHWLIVKASHNSQLEAMVRGVIDMPLVYQTFERYSPDRLRASNSHHNELVAGLRSHDGRWAESVMHAHILAARTTVIASLQAEAGPEQGEGAAPDA